MLTTASTTAKVSQYPDHSSSKRGKLKLVDYLGFQLFDYQYNTLKPNRLKEMESIAFSAQSRIKVIVKMQFFILPFLTIHTNGFNLWQWDNYPVIQ